MSAGSLAGAVRELVIGGAPPLAALLGIPAKRKGIVIFAHRRGSGRLSPRNSHVAQRLREAGLATLLLDLLSPGEEADRRNVFDIALLASRLRRATDWAASLRKRQTCLPAISAPALALAPAAVRHCARRRATPGSRQWCRAAGGPIWRARRRWHRWPRQPC
jgi:hypothetical protein